MSPVRTALNHGDDDEGHRCGKCFFERGAYGARHGPCDMANVDDRLLVVWIDADLPVVWLHETTYKYLFNSVGVFVGRQRRAVDDEAEIAWR